MKTLKLVLLSTTICLLFFSVTIFTACNKQAPGISSTPVVKKHTRGLSAITSQEDFNQLVERKVYPLNLLKSVDEKFLFREDATLVGWKGNSIPSQLTFNQYVELLKVISGKKYIFFDIKEILEGNKDMDYDIAKYKANNLMIVELLRSNPSIGADIMIAKPKHRVPDCTSNPKECPCVDTDVDATCIELGGAMSLSYLETLLF